MRTSSTRFIPFALSLGGLVLLSLGCENWESDQRKADRRINAAVARAKEIRSSFSPEEKRLSGEARRAAEAARGSKEADARKSLTDAGTKLTEVREAAEMKRLTSIVAELNKELSASTNAAASSQAKIQARSMLALAELEIADEYAKLVTPFRPRISRTIWEVQQVGARIDTLNMAIASANNSDPTKDVLVAISTRKNELTQQFNDSANKIKGLNDQIAQIQGQISQLTQQRAAQTSQADDAATKAGNAAAEEANKLQEVVINARRQADNLGHQIARLQAALLPLGRDLAAEEANKTNLQVTMGKVDEADQAAKAKWTATQDAIKGYKDQITAAVDEMKKLGDELVKLEAEFAAKQKQAVDQYDLAAADFGRSTKLGIELQKQLNDWIQNPKLNKGPEVKAWTQLKDTYDPRHFHVRHGQALHVIGALYADQADLLTQREAMLKAIDKPLKTASVEIPVALAKGPIELKAVQDLAAKAYTSAVERFTDAFIENPLPQFKNVATSAAMSRMFANFGEYVLTKADGKLKEARKDFEHLFKNNEQMKDSPMIKALPAELRA